MDAIPRESAQALGLKIRLRYLPVRLKDVFMIHNLLSRIRVRKSLLRLYINHTTYLRHRTFRKTQTRVFVTHFDESSPISAKDLKKLLLVDMFLVQNHGMKSELVKLGLAEEKIKIVYGAISHEEFFCVEDYSQVVTNQILIVSDCKPRKNPLLIEATVRSNPDFKFVIHGKNWNRFTAFAHNPSPNLEILDFDPSQHPRLLRESIALLSLSSNEGGPFPLLEAWASGTPVIATSTGFAPDLIDKDRGVLLPLYPSGDEVSEALQTCIELKRGAWNRDLTNGRFTWRALGVQLYK